MTYGDFKLNAQNLMNHNPIYPDKKRKIINDYNLSFQFYDDRYKKIQSDKYNRFFEKLELSNDILDAGCGTGLFLEYILNKQITFNHQYPRLRYTGVDISINMLRKFQMKLKRLGLPKFVNLILADIEYLPFRNKIFDKVFSITVIQNLNNIEQGLNDLIRTGNTEFDIIISILKKSSSFERFNTLVKNKLDRYGFDYTHSLEDKIIWGTISKNRK